MMVRVDAGVGLVSEGVDVEESEMRPGAETGEEIGALVLEVVARGAEEEGEQSVEEDTKVQ